MSETVMALMLREKTLMADLARLRARNDQQAHDLESAWERNTENLARVMTLDSRLAEAREALQQAHACATVRSDGTCDGCFVSDALRGLEGAR